MTRSLFFFLALAFAIACGDDGSDLDGGGLDGAVADAATDERWFELDGQLAFNGSYSFDLDPRREPELRPYDGLSRAETLLRLRTDLHFGGWRLHLEGNAFQDWLYELEGRSDFPRAVLERHCEDVGRDSSAGGVTWLANVGAHFVAAVNWGPDRPHYLEIGELAQASPCVVSV